MSIHRKNSTVLERFFLNSEPPVRYHTIKNGLWMKKKLFWYAQSLVIQAILSVQLELRVFLLLWNIEQVVWVRKLCIKIEVYRKSTVDLFKYKNYFSFHPQTITDQVLPNWWTKIKKLRELLEIRFSYYLVDFLLETRFKVESSFKEKY
jgi:hypothetical protein